MSNRFRESVRRRPVMERNILDFTCVEITANDEDPALVPSSVSHRMQGGYTRYIPNEENVAEQEELEERVADEADRQDSRERECRQSDHTPSHPRVGEVEPLWESVIVEYEHAQTDGGDGPRTQRSTDTVRESRVE